MSKAEVIAEWRAKIAQDDRWAQRALIRVYDEQTADEKSSAETKHHNGVGFTGRDAKFGSDLAQQVKRGYALSFRQRMAIRKMMPKYAGQLYRLTQENAG